MLDLRGAPGVELIRRGDPLERVPLCAASLHRREAALEARAQLIEQLDQAVAEVARGRRFRAERLLARLVDEEAAGAGRQVVLLLLERDHVQVHEVAVELPIARRRVPARSRQHLRLRVVYKIQTACVQ